MMTLTRSLLLAASATVLASCTNLMPLYERPAAPIPDTLPLTEAQAEMVAPLRWEQLVVSPELRQLIELALDENRDLMIAAQNVQLARARYGLADTSLLPRVVAGGSVTEAGTFTGGGGNIARQSASDSASAQIAVSAYELDLFGRIANQTESALQSYFATVEGDRAARITIVSAIAQAWLQLAADREFLALAEDTVSSQTESLDLTNELFDAGVATELDVRRASASVETAKAQSAQFKAAIDQDMNALRFLVGADLPAGTRAAAKLSPLPIAATLPVGQSSDLLLSRPDVIAAERNLIAAHADIGAARAAFFPTISLNGNAGYASTGLDDLFDGFGLYSFGPQISLPIFDGGARQRNLDITEAQQKIAVAQYEQAIQTAFREAADALAVSSTIDDRVASLERLVEDYAVTMNLSEEHFKSHQTAWAS